MADVGEARTRTITDHPRPGEVPPEPMTDTRFAAYVANVTAERESYRAAGNAEGVADCEAELLRCKGEGEANGR
jgi:hypothetical protein